MAAEGESKGSFVREHHRSLIMDRESRTEM
jgi:hypothetical protein